MSQADFFREYPDPLSDTLAPLTIDRQRVVCSAAFRRLQHKTQLFVAPESDHFRTRLTHTLEVAHQARCLAAALGLNAELAEVVALAHDLGHPPFGHAGERALDECLREHGGFDHNRQTLRIVEELEHPYPQFRGLNLTRVVRQCLASHTTPYDRPVTPPPRAAVSLKDGPRCKSSVYQCEGENPAQTQPSADRPAEALVVELADRLTYALHDLQDGLHAGLLTPDALWQVALWRETYAETAPPDSAWHRHLRPTIDRIQKRVLEDVVANGPQPRLSPRLSAQIEELERFLFEQLYCCEQVRRADDQAACILTAVFEGYLAHPERLPPRFRRCIEENGVHQVVTDYVAGMTDRFCLKMHARWQA